MLKKGRINDLFKALAAAIEVTTVVNDNGGIGLKQALPSAKRPTAIIDSDDEDAA